MLINGQSKPWLTWAFRVRVTEKGSPPFFIIPMCSWHSPDRNFSRKASVLGGFLSTWNKLKSSGKGGHPLRKWPQLACGQICEALSYLMADVEGPAHCGATPAQLVWGLGLYKKGSWERQWPVPPACPSDSASKFPPWLPVLTSLSDGAGLQGCEMKEIKLGECLKLIILKREKQNKKPKWEGKIGSIS